MGFSITRNKSMESTVVDIDLKALSTPELNELANDIQKEVEGRRNEEIKQAAAQMKALAAQMGMTVEQVLQSKPRQKSPVKYRNPEEPEQTWTGRGKRPSWLREALDSGRTLEEFSIE